MENRKQNLLGPFIITILCVLGGASLAATAEKDVASGKDYSGIGRFAGSVITGNEIKDFNETNRRVELVQP